MNTNFNDKAAKAVEDIKNIIKRIPILYFLIYVILSIANFILVGYLLYHSSNLEIATSKIMIKPILITFYVLSILLSIMSIILQLNLGSLPTIMNMWFVRYIPYILNALTIVLNIGPVIVSRQLGLLNDTYYSLYLSSFFMNLMTFISSIVYVSNSQ